MLPKIYTNAKVSPVGQVNKEDLISWGKNVLIFLIPVGVVYLLQLQSVLQSNGFLDVKDFIPSAMTVGAMEGYVIGQLLALLKKFANK